MKKLLRHLLRQDGISLIMAVGVLSVLSVSGTTLIYYSSTNSRSASYSNANASAYGLAEAGINEMIAILAHPSNNSLKADLLPQTTSTYDGGTVSWSGTLNQATLTWSLTSTGRIENPTGQSAAAVTRTMTARVPVVPTYTQPLNNPSWNYIFATRTGMPGGCDMTLNNNVGGGTRMFVNGNLCLQNNVAITSSPLVVHGSLKLENNAIVGSSSSRVETYVGGSGGQYCKYGNGHWHPDASHPGHPACGDADNVYSKLADGSPGVGTSPPQMAAPVADWAAWYPNAAPGPQTDCTASNGARSGTPPVFDNDATWNNSVPTVFELTAASSYTCRVGPQATPIGELSWNASSKTLTVTGTIFIDGSLKITNNATNQYNGQGTIYLSGTLLMDNNAKLCGGLSAGSCDFSAWNPNTELLTFVANGSGGQAGSGNSMRFANNNELQGGLYATSAIALENNVKTDGPMVASHVIMSNNVASDPFPLITTVPVGMPGNPAVYAQPNPPQLYGG